jgi:uncharacterized peroxidase-related enzyme
MAWIEETHEHAAEGTLKEAYARIVRALGRVIPFYRAYSVSPGHLHAHLDFYEKIAKIGVLSTRRKELIAVAVSAENGCRDCTQLHAGFLRAHRVDEAAVAALAADPGRTLADGLVAGPEAVILAYALKLTRSPRSMRAEDVQALRDAGLSEPEVFEVAFLTAYFNYTNRVGEGLGVEPEPPEPCREPEPQGTVGHSGAGLHGRSRARHGSDARLLRAHLAISVRARALAKLGRVSHRPEHLGPGGPLPIRREPDAAGRNRHRAACIPRSL